MWIPFREGEERKEKKSRIYRVRGSRDEKRRGLISIIKTYPTLCNSELKEGSYMHSRVKEEGIQRHTAKKAKKEEGADA